MAARYQILPEQQLKYVHIVAETSLQELRTLAQKYRADAQYSEALRQLIDLSGLTATEAGFSDVLTLRNFYNRTFAPVSQPIRVAIFAPTSLGYGMARMFSSIMLGSPVMKVEIFANRADALAWLRIDTAQDVLDQSLHPAQCVM